MAHRRKSPGSCFLGGVASFVVLVAGVLLAPTAASAAVTVRVPTDSPGGPFYARILAPAAADDEELAAIVFYRHPSCVPPDFNLLQFFDAPPRAFSCPLTVTGTETWRTGPGQDPAPLVTHLRAAGPVPVWFVSAAVLEEAVADGVLTIAELAALPTLTTGFANRFAEVLQPTQPGRRTASIQMTATGSLFDGTPFRLHAGAVERSGATVSQRLAIEFG